MTLHAVRFALINAALLGTGCGPAEVQAPGNEAVAQLESGLSTGESDRLLFLREEEKLARDVYLTLGAQWGTPIFTNIAASEQTHMDSVAQLLTRYQLPDPAAGRGVGEFQNTTLQALYTQLVTQGSASLVGGLTVGATIEDLDIRDLERMIADTSRPDLIKVYENLMKGSRNHLRSFTAQLEAQGVTYVPQFIDQAAFEAIVDSAPERGGR